MRTPVIPLFLFSDFITQFGAGVLLTSTNWYVLDMTGSNTLVALVSAANTVSGLVVSLFGGMLVDRYRAQNVALASHIIRTILVVIPLLLLIAFGFRIEFMVLLVLNNGIGWNLYYPSSKALIQAITNRRNVTRVNSAAEVSMQIGLFASGAVAGLLYRYWGFILIMVVSAVMFLAGILSTIMLVALLKGGAQAVPARNEGIVAGMRGGIAYLWHNMVITGLCIVLYTPFVIGNVNQTLLPGFVQTGLHADSIAFGAIQSLWGVGACLAGLTVNLIGRRIAAERMLIASIAALIVFGLALFLWQSLPVTGVLTFISGYADAVIRITLYSRLMGLIPSAYFGRTLSLMNAISLILQTLLSQVAGVMMDVVSVASGYALICAASVITLLVFLRTRSAMTEAAEPAKATYPSTR
ncbi:MFS transporter [Bifidobacterium avesanii]|uniref:MFS transporter n=1 Tax=Bifidobacterium avesanii TaxID=1798157 RepID=A0A7K3TIU4_9BIFI|nr:MFS transporter [Bifidobacterium avesanii]KAB8291923.1 transporter [Bifidobacterium avesanii]NEG79025.1 MFS transporter [Bifidobacterium avesanii]